MFTMWEKKIEFHQGMFYYINHDKISILSHAAARAMEYYYQEYQASMDINRGGESDERAYHGRGFEQDEHGDWKLKSYKVDQLAGDCPIVELYGNRRIPESCIYGKVNHLTRQAFLDSEKLTQIEIGSHIKTIGEEAFAGCKQLERIKLNPGLTQIGDNAFSDTAFYNNKRNWKQGVLYLDHWLIKVDISFVGELMVEDGTIGIADNACENCKGITKVVCPESIKYIGDRALGNCANLTKITTNNPQVEITSAVNTASDDRKEIDIPALVGDFAIYNGITYRETSYMEEVALFELNDKEKKKELKRVSKDNLQERYSALVDCDYQGVNYSVKQIKEGKCYFITYNNKEKIYCKPQEELNEIWVKKSYGEGRVKTDIIYIRDNLSQKPSELRFYVEEMHNGNLMISYLSEFLSFQDTIKLLNERYQNRIKVQKPFSIIDEIAVQMTIDQKSFCLTEDTIYDIVTISPERGNGNSYIREICDYMNTKYK